MRDLWPCANDKNSNSKKQKRLRHLQQQQPHRQRQKEVEILAAGTGGRGRVSTWRQIAILQTSNCHKHSNESPFQSHCLAISSTRTAIDTSKPSEGSRRRQVCAITAKYTSESSNDRSSCNRITRHRIVRRTTRCIAMWWGIA